MTMLRRAAVVACAVLASATSSCSDRAPPPPPPAQSALGGAIAARVGDETIPVALVADVARDQKLPREEALRRLVDDAVAAQAARKLGLDRDTPGAWRLRAVRARFTVDRMLADAKAKGGPTDEELTAISFDHWQEVDRPAAVRTVHALAMTKPGASVEVKQRARDLAEQIRGAVASASSADDFLEKAKAVPHPNDIQIVAETVPATSADGWVTEGMGMMDKRFARAANALAHPGEISPVVESDFGFHVIRLVERIPEQRMPMEARRVAFVDEAHARRARAARDARLAELRQKLPAVVEPSAETLMRLVTNGPKDGEKSP